MVLYRALPLFRMNMSKSQEGPAGPTCSGFFTAPLQDGGGTAVGRRTSFFSSEVKLKAFLSTDTGAVFE